MQNNTCVTIINVTKCFTWFGKFFLCYCRNCSREFLKKLVIMWILIFIKDVMKAIINKWILISISSKQSLLNAIFIIISQRLHAVLIFSPWIHPLHILRIGNVTLCFLVKIIQFSIRFMHYIMKYIFQVVIRVMIDT